MLCSNRTLQGNWAEERLAATEPIVRPKFEGQTTSHADFSPKVCVTLDLSLHQQLSWARVMATLTLHADALFAPSSFFNGTGQMHCVC